MNVGNVTYTMVAMDASTEKKKAPHANRKLPEEMVIIVSLIVLYLVS